MKKPNINQKGFAHWITLAILLVLLATGGVGYYVWKTNHDKSWNADNETFIVKASPSPTVTVVPPTNTTRYDHSLDIKEWGVTVSFDDADKVVYIISSDNNNATLHLKDSVTNIEGCKDLGIGFTRSTKSDPGRTSINKVGNYYYWLGGGPGACSDPESDISKLRIKIISDELGSNKYSLTATN